MDVKDFEKFISDIKEKPVALSNSERFLVTRDGQVLFGVVTMSDLIKLDAIGAQKKQRVIKKTENTEKIIKEDVNLEEIKAELDLIEDLKLKDVVTKEEACSLLHITNETLEKRIKDGLIKVQKINNIPQILSKDLAEYSVKRRKILHSISDAAAQMHTAYYTLIHFIKLGEVSAVNVSKKRKGISLEAIDSFLWKRKHLAEEDFKDETYETTKIEEPQKLLKLKETCELLKISPPLLKKKIEANEIKPIYFNSLVMFSFEEIKRYQKVQNTFNQHNYDIPTAAMHLRISTDTLRSLLAKGKIKYFKHSRKWLIPKEEIDRILSEGIS